MSFEIFKRAGVDYAVFETGMGGRLDATNIITPEVSVITKLALDHQEYLGNDIVTIAGEKLGIVKPNVPLVMLDPDDPQIKQLAGERCRAVDSELTFVNADNACNIIPDNNGVSFLYNDHQYDLSLHGTHQVQNALLALTAINKIVNIDHQTIHTALKSTTLSGRFQIVDIDGRPIILDVGHNPDAANILVNTLKTSFPDSRVLFVIGIMKDKDIASTIDILSKRAFSFYFAKPATDRAADPADLYELTKGRFQGKIAINKTISDALRAAISDADKTVNGVVCVAGSFYTVAEVKASFPRHFEPRRIIQ